MVDATLVCDGGMIPVHKLILCACSSFFQSIFKENPCQHPVVILKDMKYSELKSVLEFIYRGEISIIEEQLSGVLKTADYLKINGLGNFGSEVGTDECSSNYAVDFKQHSPPRVNRSKRKENKAFQSSTHVNTPENVSPQNLQVTCGILTNGSGFHSTSEQEFSGEKKTCSSNSESKRYLHSVNTSPNHYNGHFTKDLCMSPKEDDNVNNKGFQEYDVPKLMSQNSFDSSFCQDSAMIQTSGTTSNNSPIDQASLTFVKSEIINNLTVGEENIDVDEVLTSTDKECVESSLHDINRCSVQNLNIRNKHLSLTSNLLKCGGSLPTEGHLCPLCGNKFSTNGSMKRHLQSVHLHYRIPCPICGSRFTQKPSMERHMELVHLMSKSRLKNDVTSHKN